MVSQLTVSNGQEMDNLNVTYMALESRERGVPIITDWYPASSGQLGSPLYFKGLEAGLLLAGFWWVLPSGDTNARLRGKRKEEAKVCSGSGDMPRGAESGHVSGGARGIGGQAKAEIFLFQELQLPPVFSDFSVKQASFVLFQPFHTKLGPHLLF